MSEKMYATKFLRDEAQIKQDWLCLLMKDENAPLDVTYKAHLIKIQKEYYPFAIFDVTCEAEWQATSIWEHEEEYQIAREETVYIDYQGKEQKNSGYDYDSNMVKRYRRPMSRTVYDTKTRTIIDSTESSSGYVEPTIFSHKIWTGKSQSLLNWTNSFNNSQYISVNQDYFKDYVLIPEGITRDGAQQQAEELARKDVGRVASNDVPGDRYENMMVSSNVLEVKRASLFLGVYHIFYEYEGKNYECLMSGGNKVEDVVLGEHPIDVSIKTRQDALKDEIKKNGFLSKKTLFLLGSIALAFMSLSSLISLPLAFSMGGFFGFLSLIWLIVVVLGDAFCIYKYRLMNNRKKRAEAEKNDFNTINAQLKQKIYELIQNDSIPEEGKGNTIENWIKEYELNWQIKDDEKIDFNDDVLKQKVDQFKNLFKKNN